MQWLYCYLTWSPICEPMTWTDFALLWFFVILPLFTSIAFLDASLRGERSWFYRQIMGEPETAPTDKPDGSQPAPDR